VDKLFGSLWGLLFLKYLSKYPPSRLASFVLDGRPKFWDIFDVLHNDFLCCCTRWRGGVVYELILLPWKSSSAHNCLDDFKIKKKFSESIKWSYMSSKYGSARKVFRQRYLSVRLSFHFGPRYQERPSLLGAWLNYKCPMRCLLHMESRCHLSYNTVLLPRHCCYLQRRQKNARMPEKYRLYQTCIHPLVVQSGNFPFNFLVADIAFPATFTVTPSCKSIKNRRS